MFQRCQPQALSEHQTTCSYRSGISDCSKFEFLKQRGTLAARAHTVPTPLCVVQFALLLVHSSFVTSQMIRLLAEVQRMNQTVSVADSEGLEYEDAYNAQSARSFSEGKQTLYLCVEYFTVYIGVSFEWLSVKQ